MWLYEANLSQFVALWLVIVAIIVESQVDCNTAYSCALSTLSSTDTSHINCYGYHSCSQAASISTTSSGQIYCYGSYSCYKATLIEHTGTTSRQIYCHGLYSCALVDLINNEYGYIYCYGELACYGTTMINLLYHIYCYGTRACAASDITTYNTIYFYGTLSGQNSVIKAGDSSVTMYFYGHDAGNGASIECQSVCAINCYSTSCTNIKHMNCTGGAGSCTYYVNCYSAEKSTWCPNGYELASSLSFPDLSEMDFSTYDNSYKTCYTPITGAYNCDDYHECYDSGTISYSTPICCTGYQSCTLSSDIISSIDVNNSNFYDTGIRVDGAYGADQMTGTIKASNGGKIYLAGAYATYDTTIVETVESNGKGDIYATGIYGMAYKFVSNVNDIYCLGGFSCRYSQISNVNGMIHGGYQSLYQSSINSVVGPIYCFYYGCYSAEITNATLLLAFGYRSLYDGTVRGTKTVHIYGDEALNGAVMVSEATYYHGNDGNEFKAYINGTMSAFYYIYCNSSDICKVACQASSACATLHLVCYGACYVSCDESNGISCPFSGIYSDWSTNTDEPTGLPTVLPSIEPSYLPSSEPSSEPTDKPTSDVTSMATSMATSNAISTKEPWSGPTMESVVRETTRDDASSNGVNSGSTTTSDSSVFSDANTTLIVISCGFFGLCGVGMFFFYSFRKEKLNVAREIELKKLELVAASSVSSGKSGILPNELVNPNVKVNKIGREPSGESLYEEGNEIRIPFPPEPAPVSIETNGLAVDIGSGGESDDQENENGRANGNGNGDEDEAEIVYAVTGSAQRIDESRYESWTVKEVIFWLKSVLKNNGVDGALMKAFLKEFHSKHISGQMLKQLKSNPHFIDQMKQEFSSQNQAFGIWMVVKASITSIGDTAK